MNKLPYFTIEKKVGETPLEALSRGKKTYNISQETPCAYAGRLDPMAHGTLLILVGETCKKQDSFVKLDKEYVFKVLLGYKSDSGDILGLAQQCTTPAITRKEIKEVAQSLQGKQTLPYPHFSSKTVQGKPLFLWTLEKRLDEITIPKTNTTIYTLKHLNTKTISTDQLQKYIFNKINSLTETKETSKKLGENFRKESILKQWHTILSTKRQHTVITFRCKCTSGTYMRTLAEEIGTRLGTCGLAYSIHRTRIGKYSKIPLFPFWYKTF